MSELTRILASRYAKQWRIVDWTLGMSFAAFLIFRWQGYFRTPFAALLIGAALGFVLGFLFSRNPKARSAAR